LFPKLFEQIVFLYLCLGTRPPHQEEGLAAKRKTALEEEETETPELTLNAATVMNVIQVGGEGIKVTMIDTPDALIVSGETIVVTAIRIIETLIANWTGKIKMIGTAGAEVETAQSRPVVLHPQSVHLLAVLLTHALVLGRNPVPLLTKPNPTSPIPGCWLQRQMLSS
jgi:hypothetical protein